MERSVFLLAFSLCIVWLQQVLSIFDSNGSNLSFESYMYEYMPSKSNAITITTATATNEKEKDNNKTEKDPTMNPMSTTTVRVHNVNVNCTAPLFAVHDTVQQKVDDNDDSYRQPRDIHVTSISRCMTKPYVHNLNKWRHLGANYSFHIHDDEAVNNLLFASSSSLSSTVDVERQRQARWSKYFPKLSDALLCLPKNGASSAAKADVWRYLILWDQGGLYTDIDNAPGPRFNNNDNDDHDALIAINKRGRPNQSFLVMTPKHPLMYLALSIAIERLLGLKNLSQQRAFWITGPDVLLVAFETFTGTKKNDTIQAGLYTITPVLSEKLALQFRHRTPQEEEEAETWMMNRTLRVVGSASKADDYVQSSVINGHKKHSFYNLTGMAPWQSPSFVAHEFEGSCRDWIIGHHQRLKNQTAM